METKYVVTTTDHMQFIIFDDYLELDKLRRYLRYRVAGMTNGETSHQYEIMRILDVLSSQVGGKQVMIPCNYSQFGNIRMYLQMLREGRINPDTGKIMYSKTIEL